MAKVTIQDIKDAGFRAEQFGTPADWDVEPGGYLARLVSRAGIWASGRLGSAVYAAQAAGTPEYEYTRAAELCWVRGHLWNRRAGFIDSNAVSALDNLVHADRREFEAQAARAFECAEDNIAFAAGTAPDFSGSAVALAYAVSGPFAPRPDGGLS